jgi:hypothetical protein
MQEDAFTAEAGRDKPEAMAVSPLGNFSLVPQIRCSLRPSCRLVSFVSTFLSRARRPAYKFATVIASFVHAAEPRRLTWGWLIPLVFFCGSGGFSTARLGERTFPGVFFVAEAQFWRKRISGGKSQVLQPAMHAIPSRFTLPDEKDPGNDASPGLFAQPHTSHAPRSSRLPPPPSGICA